MFKFFWVDSRDSSDEIPLKNKVGLKKLSGMILWE